MYPDIKIVEAYHHEVYDLVMECGINYNTLWKDFDRIFPTFDFGISRSKGDYQTLVFRVLLC